MLQQILSVKKKLQVRMLLLGTLHSAPLCAMLHLFPAKWTKRTTSAETKSVQTKTPDMQCPFPVHGPYLQAS